MAGEGGERIGDISGLDITVLGSDHRVVHGDCIHQESLEGLRRKPPRVFDYPNPFGWGIYFSALLSALMSRKGVEVAEGSQSLKHSTH